MSLISLLNEIEIQKQDANIFSLIKNYRFWVIFKLQDYFIQHCCVNQILLSASMEERDSKIQAIFQGEKKRIRIPVFQNSSQKSFDRKCLYGSILGQFKNPDSWGHGDNCETCGKVTSHHFFSIMLADQLNLDRQDVYWYFLLKVSYYTTGLHFTKELTLQISSV